MGKEAEQINPLVFLKIIVPFVFPLVGFLLPPLYPISTPSETDSYNNSVEEEEEEEEEEVEHHQQMDSIVPTLQTEFVSPNVVRIEQIEEPSLEEEIERLNNRVSDVEEQADQIELDFSEYRSMKNYESLIEKLQIMCLGLKMEYLEDQNQRLEGTVAKLMGEKEEFEAMKVEIQRLKKNIEKISKKNEQTLLMVHQRMQDYEAREAELLKRNDDLEVAVRDAKEMMNMKDKCTSKV